MRHWVLMAGLCLGASWAQAHPHVFVNTDLRFEADADGNIVAVNVTWAYDDFFSLLIFEDRGLDPDGDGVLTDAELKNLWGFDLEVWPEGFEGDLYIYSDGEKIEMPRPVTTGIGVEDGRIIARHRREIPPVNPEGLEIMQYDPTFYVEYAVNDLVFVDGAPCEGTVIRANRRVAAAEVKKELGTIPEDILDEMRVGVFYSDKIKLTCAQPSN